MKGKLAMILGNLLMLLPVIGLIVFWLLPLSLAIPIYAVILIISGLFYYVMIKSMRQPVRTGNKSLAGEMAEVINMTNHEGQVKVHGEIWHAESSDEFRKGDMAKITEVRGMTLLIEKASLPKMQMSIQKHCVR